MAMTTILDTSNVPCSLLISNTYTPKSLVNYVTELSAADPSASSALINAKAIEARNNEIRINTINLPVYPNNAYLAIAPEEQIIVKVDSSKEYIYYYTTVTGIDPARKTFTIAEVEPEEEGGEPEEEGGGGG